MVKAQNWKMMKIVYVFIDKIDSSMIQWQVLNDSMQVLNDSITWFV